MPEEKSKTEEKTKANGQGGQTAETNKQDAIQLLKADHRKVEELFAKYENAKSRTEKRSLATEICKELIVHAKIEEEIFYPACREHTEDEKGLDEAQVEHDGAKILIADLICGSPESQYFDAKVTVLAEQIRHHVKEEEKRSEGIFAKAKDAGLDTDALGEKLAARKKQLAEEIAQSGLAPPEPVSLTAQPQKENQMRQDQRMPDRDEYGRFVGDDDRYRARGRGSSRYDEDDDDRYGRSRSSNYSSNYRSRDDQGRFTSDDDDNRYSRGRDYRDDDRDNRGRYGSGRERDEQGRFMSDDDDDRRYSRSRGSGRERDDQGRFTSDDDDYRRSSRSSSSRGGRYEDEGGRGWYGDPQGHSEASRQGWESRRGDYDDRGNGQRSGNYSSRGSRSSSYGDYSSDHGQGGWFGDSEGHSRAARKGWRNRD